jgi:inner membrane protein
MKRENGMASVIGGLRESSSAKAAVIGVLVLILLIPVAMIRGVIDDRQANSQYSRQEIMRAWGEQQTFGGPILSVPYKLERVTQYGERMITEGSAYFLPRDLSVDVELVPEIRYRGIHKVPVYTARTRVTGSFSAPTIEGLGIDDAKVDWNRASLALSITDARPLKNAPQVEMNGKRSRFESGGSEVPGIAAQITAPIGKLIDDSTPETDFRFSIDLDISGTDRFRVLPFGDETRVSMRSVWPSPSFVGGYLPEVREISDQGFSASWRISSLGRSYPSRWTSADAGIVSSEPTAFGVDLYLPIGLYQLTTRATKYAVLFVGLTFVAYFLFEVIADLRLHPLQYLLVGLANTLFYLLLLSLAEHTGFAAAYIISALASAGLITGYSRSILGSRARALLMMLILAVLYGVLYLTLRAENYAMLAGSIGLWATLGLIMYLTRKVNWFGQDKERAAGSST